MIRSCLLTLVLTHILACQGPKEKIESVDQNFQSLALSKAKAFSIETKGELSRIRIFHPENPKVIIQEILIGDGVEETGNALILTEPVKRVAVLSTTYLEYIRSLGKLSTISCATNVDLIFSPEINKKVDAELIVDLGNEEAFNIERLIDSKIDLAFYYDFGPSTASMIKRLEDLGIVVIRVSEYLEKDPLGKAEWIKFFGAIYGKMDEAEAIFNGIKNQYEELQRLTSQSAANKSVFTGLPWKGEWHQPGGASFQATYFSDAGADYLWKENTSVSGILMDREVIFNKALNADIWIHPNNVLNLDDIVASDKRFSQFKSFQNGDVYNNNKRLNEHMGNDYWESGLLNPHLVLKDLISIFQPASLPDHELYYYQKLN